MSNKKEKVEFVRTEQFEAVEDELAQAMGLLDETNARIVELLNSESRGDLPFLNMPPELPAAAPSPEADLPAAEAGSAKEATPRVRRARAASGSKS